jgi:WW domain-containing oxidoreductase
MAFNRKSTAEEGTEGIDLSGKTVVITGVNSGIGAETMRVLAMRGANILGLARTREKADDACSSVDGQATGFACELSDFASVRACAENIKALGVPIDVLITNAGIMAPATLSHAHDLEMQYATNHMGHFVLLHNLLDCVTAAEAGRIVMPSSAAHMMTPRGGINFNNLDASRGYSACQFYGQSKLANLLTAKHLAQKLKGSNTTVNAVHPGVINTNLARDVGGVFSAAMGMVMPAIAKSVAQGAATQCYVACSDEVECVTGEYFADCKIARSSRHGRNMKLARQLWEDSERLAMEYLKP